MKNSYSILRIPDLILSPLWITWQWLLCAFKQLLNIVVRTSCSASWEAGYSFLKKPDTWKSRYVNSMTVPTSRKVSLQWKSYALRAQMPSVGILYVHVFTCSWLDFLRHWFKGLLFAMTFDWPLNHWHIGGMHFLGAIILEKQVFHLLYCIGKLMYFVHWFSVCIMNPLLSLVVFHQL